MADKRAYFKMDVGYLSNPKVAALLDEHPRAILLHLECIAYSAQHLTDGVVPMRMAMRLACAEQCDLELLLQCGLLERLNDREVAVHDYLEHQRSAKEAKKASDQGKRAASTRWAGADGTAASNAGSMPGALLNPMPREKREKDSSPGIADALPTREDVEDLCQRLAEHIEANGGKRPNITKGWRDAARLLLDRDGRDQAEAESLIDWCQRDEFWHANILSMPKFREKYDQLRFKAKGHLRAVPAANDNPWDRFVPPDPPEGVADDPAEYERWLKSERAKWDAKRAGGDR